MYLRCENLTVLLLEPAVSISAAAADFLSVMCRPFENTVTFLHEMEISVACARENNYFHRMVIFPKTLTDP